MSDPVREYLTKYGPPADDPVESYLARYGPPSGAVILPDITTTAESDNPFVKGLADAAPIQAARRRGAMEALGREVRGFGAGLASGAAYTLTSAADALSRNGGMGLGAVRPDFREAPATNAAASLARRAVGLQSDEFTGGELLGNLAAGPLEGAVTRRLGPLAERGIRAIRDVPDDITRAVGEGLASRPLTEPGPVAEPLRPLAIRATDPPELVSAKRIMNERRAIRPLDAPTLRPEEQARYVEAAKARIAARQAPVEPPPAPEPVAPTPRIVAKQVRGRTVYEGGHERFRTWSDEKLLARHHELLDRLQAKSAEIDANVTQWSREDPNSLNVETGGIGTRSGTSITGAGGRAIGRYKDDGRLMDEVLAEAEGRGLDTMGDYERHVEQRAIAEEGRRAAYFSQNRDDLPFSLRGLLGNERGALGVPGGPGFSSRLVESVKRAKLDKAPAQTWISKLRGQGHSADEFDWALGDALASDPKRQWTRSELLDMAERRGYGALEETTLREPTPYAERTVEEDLAEAPRPKFRQYTEPGGSHYREVLLRVPEKLPEGFSVEQFGDIDGGKTWGVRFPDGRVVTGWKTREAAISSQRNQAGSAAFTSSHWDEPNVLAHIRMNDRTGPNGEKILHVEEIQSDWHQKGRKGGYQNPARLNALDAKLKAQGKLSPEEAAEYNRLTDAESMPHKTGAVPNAPLKETPEWMGLAMKRVLDEAVAGGYDAVSWTPGAKQADRYSLRKVADEVTYSPETSLLRVLNKGDVVHEGKYAPEALPDVIGKDAADKLLATKSKEITTRRYRISPSGDGVNYDVLDQHKNEMVMRSIPRSEAVSMVESLQQRGSKIEHRLTGQQLEIGGEGMKAFYDEMLPNWLRGYGKKLGVTLEPKQGWFGGRFTDGHLTNAPMIRITPEVRAALGKGQTYGKGATPILTGTVGAGLGATAGAKNDPDHPLRGALIGGVAGAAIGGSLGAKAEAAAPLGERGAVPLRAEPVPTPKRTAPGIPETTELPGVDDLVNVAKFDLTDPAGTIRLRQEVSRMAEATGSAWKRPVTHEELRATAAKIGLEVTKGDATRMNGAEMLATRNLISSNVDQMEKLATQLQDANLAPQQRDKLLRQMSTMDTQNVALLERFSKARTAAGRDLNSLKVLANRSLAPDLWLMKARQMTGEARFTPEVRARVLELVKKAQDAGGPGMVRGLDVPPPKGMGRGGMLGNQRGAVGVMPMPEEASGLDPRAELVQYIASLRQASTWEKSVTLYKANFLTLPKTHAVNVSSNTALGAMEVAKDIPASLADRVMALVTKKRTVAMPTGRMLVEGAKGAKQGVAEAKQIMQGVPLADALQRYDIPHETNFDNPILDAYTKGVFRLLGAEDRVFRGAALRYSLANQMRAARIAEPTDDMVVQAIADAEQATVQDATAAGNLLQGIGKFAPGGVPVGHFVVPFTRTPGAVATRLAEYSPAGAVVGAGKVIGVIQKSLRGVELGATEQREAARLLGRGVTGSGLVALGYWLGKRGLATGPGSEDAAERSTDQLVGKAPNSVKIGHQMVEVGRLSPAGNLLALGVSLSQQPDAASAAATLPGTVAKTVLDQPFLQGISGAIESAKNPVQAGSKVAQNVATGLVPASALVAGIARGSDPTVREVHGVGDAIQARIPGLSQRLPAQLNQFGEPIQREGGWLDAIINLTPIRTDKRDSDPLLREIDRLGVQISRRSERIPREQVLREGPALRQRLTDIARAPLSDEAKRQQMEDAIQQVRSRASAETARMGASGRPERPVRPTRPPRPVRP